MKNLLLILLISTIGIRAAAQESISFGPVAGVNFSNISDMPGTTEHNTGLVLGAQLTHSHINNWGIGVAVLYSKEGVAWNAPAGKTHINQTYLRIPLKGIIFFRGNEDAFRPKIFFGPSFALLLDSDTEIAGGEKFETKDNYKTIDLGLMAGAGFNARLTEGIWLNVDAGYTYGLLDISDESTSEASNRNIGVTAGIAFGF